MLQGFQVGRKPERKTTMSTPSDNIARQAHLEGLKALDKPWASLLWDPSKSANQTFVMEDYLPGESILASYANQWYRLTINGRHFAIRRKGGKHEAFSHLWPLPTAVPEELENLLGGWLIGYMNPDGSPSSREAVSERRSQALAIATGPDRHILDVVAIQRDSQWLEPMLLVSGLSRKEAQQIAREMGQHFLVELGKEWLRLNGTDQNWRQGSSRWHLIELDEPPCPMSLGYQVSEKPTNPGGPYVSRSMLVHGQWQSHHAYTHDLVDCSACGTSQAEIAETPQGEPDHWLPATRFSTIKAESDYIGDREVLRRFEPETPTPRHGGIVIRQTD